MESLEGHEGIEWTVSRSTIHLEKVVFCLMKRWSAGTQLLKCIVGHSESSFWRWDTKEGYSGDYLGISWNILQE